MYALVQVVSDEVSGVTKVDSSRNDCDRSLKRDSPEGPLTVLVGPCAVALWSMA